jgi:hypothetical protein
MEAKHTKAPWRRNIRANGKYPVIFAGRNQHVATASRQADPAEVEANIDLIAAAPELLEACAGLLQIVQDCMPSCRYPDSEDYELITLASEAIAKAKGTEGWRILEDNHASGVAEREK